MVFWGDHMVFWGDHMVFWGSHGFWGGSHGFLGERKEDQSSPTEYKGRGGGGL